MSVEHLEDVGKLVHMLQEINEREALIDWDQYYCLPPN